MIIDGNMLYFSSSDGNGSVYRINLTDTNNTITQVISNLGGMTFGLAIQNDDLYATLRLSNKIVKIDEMMKELDQYPDTDLDNVRQAFESGRKSRTEHSPAR